VPQNTHRSEFQITPENQANYLSLDLVHDQLALFDVVAERDIAAGDLTDLPARVGARVARVGLQFGEEPDSDLEAVRRVGYAVLI